MQITTMKLLTAGPENKDVTINTKSARSIKAFEDAIGDVEVSLVFKGVEPRMAS